MNEKLELLFEATNVEKGNYEKLELVILEALEVKGILMEDVLNEYEDEYRLMIAYPTIEEYRQWVKDVVNNEEKFCAWVIGKYNLI